MNALMIFYMWDSFKDRKAGKINKRKLLVNMVDLAIMGNISSCSKHIKMLNNTEHNFSFNVHI